MGNLVSPSADEPDNRRAPTSTAELPTERDNDAAPALGARPNQEREPAARHSITVNAKFHYAILVADSYEVGHRPVADLLARASSLLASELDDRPNFNSLQVCDQPRACLRLG